MLAIHHPWYQKPPFWPRWGTPHAPSVQVAPWVGSIVLGIVWWTKQKGELVGSFNEIVLALLFSWDALGPCWTMNSCFIFQVRHYELKRVARRRKFFSLVLLLYRLFAAVLLVWVGTYFLVYTVSVTELTLGRIVGWLEEQGKRWKFIRFGGWDAQFLILFDAATVTNR